MHYCDYGCGKEATHQFKNGNWCCTNIRQRCSAIIEKNSKSSFGIKSSKKGKTWKEIYGQQKALILKNKAKKRMKNNKHALGFKHTEEFKIAAAERLKYNHNTLGFKHTEESKIKISEHLRGSKNPSWKGGVSFEPYCSEFNSKEFKDIIKERDGNACINPCCKKESSYINIHHINYIKKDCRFKNLITLCVSCNSIANFNRKWHTAWYQTILFKRYKYDY